MKALLIALSLAGGASAQTAPKAGDAACAAPRRLNGNWSGRMNCRAGGRSAVFMVRPSTDGSCVNASWNGASNGALKVSATAKPGVYLMASDQTTAILRIFDKGRRLTFSPDPAATGLAKLVKFSGSATLDAAMTKAVVRYTLSTPLAPPDSCLGTMTRSPDQRHEHTDSDGSR